MKERTYKTRLFIILSLAFLMFLGDLFVLYLSFRDINESPKNAIGEITTGLLIVFVIIYLIFTLIKYLGKGYEDMINGGFRKERRMGYEGVAFLMLGLFLFTYSIVLLFTLIGNYKQIVLIHSFINMGISFLSILSGILELKLSALIYRDLLNSKKEEETKQSSI